MRKLLTLFIPVVLGVGLLAAAINDTDEKTPQQAIQQGGVTNTTLPAVIEGPPVAETSSTTATTAAPETTTTTAAPVTTTTRPRAVTPTTAFRPAPTPTTTAPPAPVQAAQPSTVDCGTGSATAISKIVRGPDGKYAITAVVNNKSTKAIQLDSLVVRAVYGGVEKTYRVEAGGRIVESGTEKSFDIPESAADAPPSSFDIDEFKFHTAGLPECSSRA